MRILEAEFRAIRCQNKFRGFKFFTFSTNPEQGSLRNYLLNESLLTSKKNRKYQLPMNSLAIESVWKTSFHSKRTSLAIDTDSQERNPQET